MQGGSRDPATPWFDAAQDRVSDSPLGTLHRDHPIRRAIRRATFPASREDVVDVVTASGELTPEQAAWLASSLPDDMFASEADVVDALGRWGAPPPGAERPL